MTTSLIAAARRTALAAGFMLAATGSAQAAGVLNGPISFSQPGFVTLTLDFSSGGYDHILELADVAGDVGTPLLALTAIGDPDASPEVLGNPVAALGDSVGLGHFAANSELIFRLTSVGSLRLGTPGAITVQTFTGSKSDLNPKSDLDADPDWFSYVEIVDATTIKVYLEDLFGIGIDEQNPVELLREGHDVAFILTLAPTPVPLPATLPLMLTATCAVAWRARRRARLTVV